MNDSLYLEEFGLYDVPTSKTFDKLDEEQPSSSAKHLDEQNFSPNRPHQALEYPPLYFMLRKYPQLLENIKKFYIFRWCTSYPFQKHIPCSSALRKIGVHLTWGETLFLVPFFIAILFAIIFTTLSLSLAGTGHVAQAALIACFILAQRNSLITLLIGMPIDRTLFYHKLSGRVAFLGTLSHTWAFLIQSKSTPKLASMFADPVNASGAVMMTMIIGIILASLPYFRRQTFELFYYVHIICVFGLVCGAFFDTGILVPIIVVSTWGVDIFLRSAVMARHRYPRKANIRILSDTIIELSFPKVSGFDYNAGQHIYISLPDISWLEWHPFWFKSCPKMNTVTLYIRKTGNWTSALYELAKKQSEVSIMMEGPYGSVGVDLLSDRYKMVMLVSGGIGRKYCALHFSDDLSGTHSY